MKQLENIQVSDMKHILSHLKQYDDMTKKLGSRGKKLFQKTLSGEKSFVVEYFSAL